MKTTVIYRTDLLPYSEVFIPSQAENVPGYSPKYLGLRQMDQVKIPAERLLAPKRNASKAARVRTYLGLSRWVQRTLESVQPSLVHAHFGPDALTICRHVQKLGVPLISTFHGYDILNTANGSGGMATQLWRRRMAVVFDHSTKLISVSDFLRDRAMELGAPERLIETHYIGVDVEKFTPSTTDERDSATVLFVGRFVLGKGILDLLEAMQTVQRFLPHARLLVVGDGELRPVVEREIGKLGSGAVLLGRRSHSEVAELMRKCTVLCVPSKSGDLGGREAFGLVFSEAQASELPVVSCRTGGVPEAVQDGVTGLLAKEGDVAEIASHLLTLLTDNGLRASMGREGRSRVVLLHNLALQGAKLAVIYRAAEQEFSGANRSRRLPDERLTSS